MTANINTKEDINYRISQLSDNQKQLKRSICQMEETLMKTRGSMIDNMKEISYLQNMLSKSSI